MLATVVAFSIFLTNPTGTLGPKAGQQAAPYFFPNESQEREYATMEECEQGITQAHTAQASALQALYQEDSAKYYSLKAKYDSMQCQKVTRQIETNDVVTVEDHPKVDAPTLPASAVQRNTYEPYKTVYRIGRFDGSHVFHGTVYNTKDYDTQEQCSEAYHTTEDQVTQRAVREGGDSEGVEQVLKQFDTTYACHLITIDANAPAQAPESHLQTTQPLPYAPNQQLLNVNYNPNPFSTVPMPHYSNKPAQIVMVQAPPMRKYYMAELVSGEGLTPYWEIYDQEYSSIAQCHAAIEQDVGDYQSSIQDQYTRMSVNVGITNAQRWFQLQIQSLQARHSRMQCVTR